MFNSSQKYLKIAASSAGFTAIERRGGPGHNDPLIIPSVLIFALLYVVCEHNQMGPSPRSPIFYLIRRNIKYLF